MHVLQTDLSKVKCLQLHDENDQTKSSFEVRLLSTSASVQLCIIIDISCQDSDSRKLTPAKKVVRLDVNLPRFENGYQASTFRGRRKWRCRAIEYVEKVESFTAITHRQSKFGGNK